MHVVRAGDDRGIRDEDKGAFEMPRFFGTLPRKTKAHLSADTGHKLEYGSSYGAGYEAYPLKIYIFFFQ